MKTKLLYLLLLALPLLASAQDKRELLKGILINDTLQVEDVMVFNLSTDRMVNADGKGNFAIYAKKGDTLYMNSITFRDMRMVLKEEDVRQSPLVIRMFLSATTLEEVKVNKLTGNLAADVTSLTVTPRNLKTNPDDFKTYPISKQPLNGALPVTESQLKGVDFIAIGKMIFKKRKKAEDVKGVDKRKTFGEVVTARFTEYFFTETLQIPENEIGRFLTFCDTGKDARKLLDPKNEFALTDYLVQKSKEYKKQ